MFARCADVSDCKAEPPALAAKSNQWRIQGLEGGFHAHVHSNFHLRIVEDDVKKAFSNAGLNIVYTDIQNLPESARHILNDAKANYFIVGQKPI